jgi:hypothetical protein
MTNDKLVASPFKSVSTEDHLSVNDVWHCIIDNAEGCAVISTHNLTIGFFSMQTWLRQPNYYILKMSINDS